MIQNLGLTLTRNQCLSNNFKVYVKYSHLLDLLVMYLPNLIQLLHLMYFYSLVYSVLEYGSIIWNHFLDVTHIVNERGWLYSGNSYVTLRINRTVYSFLPHVYSFSITSTIKKPNNKKNRT